MARMQVYLPDDLYKQVKARGLPASELLQKAVRAELRRLELLSGTNLFPEDADDIGRIVAEELKRLDVSNAHETDALKWAAAVHL